MPTCAPCCPLALRQCFEKFVFPLPVPVYDQHSPANLADAFENRPPLVQSLEFTQLSKVLRAGEAERLLPGLASCHLRPSTSNFRSHNFRARPLSLFLAANLLRSPSFACSRFHNRFWLAIPLAIVNTWHVDWQRSLGYEPKNVSSLCNGKS